jgi:hypothetical protein
MPRWLQAIGLLLLGAALATAFIAYHRPGLLIDTANVSYCG